MTGRLAACLLWVAAFFPALGQAAVYTVTFDSGGAFAFTPNQLSITAGDTVNFPSSTVHPFVIQDPTGATACLPADTSGSVVIQFNLTGTYEFHCAVHGICSGATGCDTCSNMAGAVFVFAPTPSPTATPFVSDTVSPTPLDTAVDTQTFSPTSTPTVTPPDTPADTQTFSPTESPLDTLLPTATESSTPLASATNSPTPQAHATYTVAFGAGLFYSPNQVTITVGDSVTFPSSTTHPFVIQDPSGVTFCLPSDTSGSVTLQFNLAGTFEFHCAVHGSCSGATGCNSCFNMAGAVFVLGPSPTPSPVLSSTNTAVIPPSPTPSASPSPLLSASPTPTPQPPAPTPVVVNVQGAGPYTYSPSLITLSPGDTVSFPASGFHPFIIQDPTGATSCLPANTSGPVVVQFNLVGTYEFHCFNHGSCSGAGGSPCDTCGGMAGKVVVGNPTLTFTPVAAGSTATSTPTETPTPLPGTFTAVDHFEASPNPAAGSSFNLAYHLLAPAESVEVRLYSSGFNMVRSYKLGPAPAGWKSDRLNVPAGLGGICFVQILCGQGGQEARSKIGEVYLVP